MTGFLSRACAEARERVVEAARLVPLDLLQGVEMPTPPSLARAVDQRRVTVIAEIKRASPSRGHLAWVPDPAARARAYVAGGAAAVSVLTEPLHFRGCLPDLEVVAAAVDVPVLRKDFIVDPYQVWQARRAGAAAVLLIVAALGKGDLEALLRETRTAGLEALVEVHDPGEAERAAAAFEDVCWEPRPVIGVNARDLQTLEIDAGRFASCVGALPRRALAVAESGVSGPEDVARAVAAGARAVLVGEHLVTAPDPEGAVKALLDAGAGDEGPDLTATRFALDRARQSLRSVDGGLHEPQPSGPTKNLTGLSDASGTDDVTGSLA